jgi:hypothetical protein
VADAITIVQNSGVNQRSTVTTPHPESVASPMIRSSSRAVLTGTLSIAALQ